MSRQPPVSKQETFVDSNGRSERARVSVIVPVLNEASRIDSLLQELQCFRQAGHELIVVDGGSSDDTVKKATLLCDLVLLSETGRAKQMNAGALKASGDVLLFHHCDSVLPAGAVSLMEAQRDSGWGRFNVRLTGAHPMFRVIAFMMNWRSRLTGIATGDQSLFISKKLFEQVGYYPEQYLMEDIEISSRLKKISPPVCLKEEVTTSSRRWQKKGIWPTILLMWRLRLSYFMGVSADQLVHQYYPNFRPRDEKNTDSVCKSSGPRES